jgi:hypothetical protein
VKDMEAGLIFKDGLVDIADSGLDKYLTKEPSKWKLKMFL